MPAITKPQAHALERAFSRAEPKPSEPDALRAWWSRFRAFRKTVVHASYDGCILVPWCGMWLGIERDGYSHT